jgi:hypothetical protein
LGKEDSLGRRDDVAPFCVETIFPGFLKVLPCPEFMEIGEMHDTQDEWIES